MDGEERAGTGRQCPQVRIQVLQPAEPSHVLDQEPSIFEVMMRPDATDDVEEMSSSFADCRNRDALASYYSRKIRERIFDSYQ
jgi:hypothetical protein